MRMAMRRRGLVVTCALVVAALSGLALQRALSTPRVTVSLTRVQFPTLFPGQVSERAIRLTNHGSRPASLRSAPPAAPFELVSSPAEVPPGTSVVVVRFRPERAGDSQGQLQLFAGGRRIGAVALIGMAEEAPSLLAGRNKL